MNKLIYVILLSVLVLTNSGCMSYMAHKNWAQAKQERAVRIEADGTEVRVGVDLAAMTYLKENWPMALGAALVDGGIAYGAYRLVDELTDSGGSRTTHAASGGRDGYAVTVTGDGNTIQIRGDENNIGAGTIDAGTGASAGTGTVE